MVLHLAGARTAAWRNPPSELAAAPTAQHQAGVRQIYNVMQRVLVQDSTTL